MSPWLSLASGHGWRLSETRALMVAACLAGGFVSDGNSQGTVSNLLARYDTLDSVVCDVRRDVESGGQRGRRLSRVAFERGGRLHVENLAPLRRRIVCDGTNFFSHAEGDPLGFSRPVAGLDEPMRIGLFAVPGTPMEHLLRLKDRTETLLPDAPEWSRRVGVQGDPLYAILCFDAEDRLVRVELFPDAGARQPDAVWTYEGFVDPGGGAWIASVHRTEVRAGDGESVRETARFDNLRVGAAIDDSMFDPLRHFSGVTFTNTFEAIYR